MVRLIKNYLIFFLTFKLHPTHPIQMKDIEWPDTVPLFRVINDEEILIKYPDFHSFTTVSKERPRIPSKNVFQASDLHRILKQIMRFPT